MKLPLSLIPVAAVVMTLAGAATAKADEFVVDSYRTPPALLQVRYEGEGYRPWWRREHRWSERDYDWHRPWWRRDRPTYGWNDRRDVRDGRWR
jgi:hypothetical protein